ncbi:MAG: tRNA 2-thiouridine(34) synthase MnmA [Elusimicrobia bacterium]|nr:tRNA 2-thiouridine(34) synthase MnmA [Elusimicrobiota bacterium]
MIVAVGLSGGVDSAVAARLLQEQGHEVLGITMRTWDGCAPLEDRGLSGCYGPGEARDLESAARVCARLGIAHHVLDLSREFNALVLDYFRAEYRAGRTPNPCVRCNRAVKFGALLAQARRRGLRFERFATGHYARLEAKDGGVRLRRAADRRKDQSYFLAGLAQEQLRELVLPLGGLEKSRVKELARSLGWTDLAEKPESQDFVECRGYAPLFGAADSRPGPILDLAGRRLGEHRGIVHYTVGQRKGVGLGGGAAPLYVARIDASAGAVVVGPESALYRRTFSVRELRWAHGAAPAGPARLRVQIRQRHRAAPARVVPGPAADEAAVAFDEPQRAVTPGQAAVFYAGDAVSGCGTIADMDQNASPMLR